MLIVFKYMIYTIFAVILFVILIYSGPKLGSLIGDMMGIPKEKTKEKLERWKIINIISDVILVILFSYFTMFHK